MIITLTSDHGKYLCAEPDGRVVADRDVAGPWEDWRAESLPDGRWAFRSAHGRYLCAELDGSVIADRVGVGPWESWTVTRDEARCTLQSHHGKYLVAGHDGTILADRDVAGPWEHFTYAPPSWLEPPAPEPPQGLVGRLRVQGRGYADSAGLVLPVFCHFGEAFSAYVRRPDEVRRQLDVIAETGYHGIRFWDVLGYYDAAWRGKEVTPVRFTNRSGVWVEATRNYYDHLERFLNECRVRNLRVHHSRGDLNAMRWSDVLEHCQRVREVQEHVGQHVVALNEACNESWQNGVPEPEKLAQMALLLGGHALRALSTSTTEEPVDVLSFAIPPADVWYIHGWRDGSSADRLRHIFSLGYDGPGKADQRPGWQGEPAGPGDGVTVGREEHPEALCLMVQMALLSRQAWVYMSGAGVFWNRPIETMTAFAEVPKAAKQLPADIMLWPTRCHGGTTWRGTRVFAVTDDHARADHCLDPATKRFAAILYGPEGAHRWTVERAFEGEIVTPHTGERHPFKGSVGETKTVQFQRGRLVLGRLL